MEPKLKETLDKIFGNVFGYKNPFTPEQFMQKFAFDVRLPKQTNDSVTGEVTWAQSLAPGRFITAENSKKMTDKFELPLRSLKTIEEILNAWQETNMMATERHKESLNVFESDNIYNSDTVFRCLDIHRSKNIAYCDSVLDSEFVAASQRSSSLTYCIRVEDSKECSKSFNVIWSGKITNSMFIQDCYDMFECMFCSHMTGKKYCIANMQFEEAEYFELKKLVIDWLLKS